MQEAVSLWVGRAVALGGLVGFLVGRINLPDTPILNYLGRTQLQILSAIVSLILLAVHLGVSLCVTEQVLESRAPDGLRSFKLEWRAVSGKVSQYVQTIPKAVKQICWILFCTWVGLFPFIFWGSFWIAGLYKNERVPRSTSAAQTSSLGLDEEATRAASSALAWHAGTGLVFAIGLPFFISNQEHRVSRFIGYRLDLVAAWGLGQLVFALCMFSTWFIHSYRLATIMFALLGFPAAMFHWAPYALLGEAIAKKSRNPALGEPTPEGESSPLLSPSTIDGPTDVPSEAPTQVEHKAGELLGLSNVFVVLPQFLIIGLSSLIFAVLEPDRTVIPQEYEGGKDPRSLEIIFSIGGLSALVGLSLTIRLGRTRRALASL